MILALIPARFASKRLPGKPLIKIDNLPLIIHIYKRALMSKKIDKVIVCADDKRIKEIVEHYGGICELTKKSHKNGTERIAEISLKYKKKAKLIIDIQCDEIFLNPKHVDKLISFHLKNKEFDIIVPNCRISKNDAKNINTVKIIAGSHKKIVYMTRSMAPSFFRSKIKFDYRKHLDFISFRPTSLHKYVKLKKSINENNEGIELNRAIDNNFKLGTYEVKTNAFSINTNKDLAKAKNMIRKCKIRKKY
tara:strand:- start:1273 stop:2019 length:747 start_codon:yes stop_codon:yes gene_type:complete